MSVELLNRLSEIVSIIETGIESLTFKEVKGLLNELENMLEHINEK